MYARSHRRAPSMTGCICRWTCQWRFIGTSPITLWIGNHAGPFLHPSAQPQRPPRPSQGQPPAPGQAEFVICDQPIENFFCKLKEFKRIALRADKTDQSFEAMIYLAAAVINSR